jgi:hypothetical protein
MSALKRQRARDRFELRAESPILPSHNPNPMNRIKRLAGTMDRDKLTNAALFMLIALLIYVYKLNKLYGTFFLES